MNKVASQSYRAIQRPATVNIRANEMSCNCQSLEPCLFCRITPFFSFFYCKMCTGKFGVFSLFYRCGNANDMFLLAIKIQEGVGL